MLVLVLVCVLGGAAQAQAAVRLVSEAGTDTGDCISSACATPDYAVGLAVSGDTVEIANGNYDVTNISFNAPITLQGALGGPRPILTKGPSMLISVGAAATGSTIRHLKLESTDSVGGPLIENFATTATFDDLELVATAPLGSSYAYGIANGGSGTGTITISNSTFNFQTGASEGVINHTAPAQLTLRDVAITREGGGESQAPALNITAGRLDADDVQLFTDQARCLWVQTTSASGHVVSDLTATQNGQGTTTSQPCIQIDRTGTYDNVDVNSPDTQNVAAVRVGEPFGTTSTAGTTLRDLTVVSRGDGLFVGNVNGFVLRRGNVLAGIGITGNADAAVVAYDTAGVFSDLVAHGIAASTAGFRADGFAEFDIRNLTAISRGNAPALLAAGSTTVTAKNVIARGYGTGSDVATDLAGTLRLTNSNYVDTTAGGALLSDTGGRQMSDPLFVNPSPVDLLLADFHLQSGSPAINAGAADILNGTLDFDGQTTRPSGPAPDIGADEFPTPPPAPDDGGGDDGGGGGTTEPPAPAPTDPTPAPAPPTPVPTQVVPGPVVAISASAVRVTKTGVANIRIGCPATAASACTGTLRLQTATPVRPAQRRRVVQLGRRSFRIAAGRQAFVGVKLTKAARRLLRRDKRIRVKALANVRDANGASRITQRLLSLKLR